jgi:hypothetical protein
MPILPRSKAPARRLLLSLLAPPALLARPALLAPPALLALLALLALPAAAGLTGCIGWTRDPQGRPEYLASYIDTHYDDLGTRFVQPVSRTGFAARLEGARVLFLGDHHRDHQLHARILELIEWICESGHRPVMGVEAVGIQDDASLQEYLSGDIELQVLRRRIARRWPHSWLDNPEVDAPFFRDLLGLARAHRLPTFALEPTPRLALGERDAIIAQNIRRAVRLHPDRLIIVLVGHAHLFGQGHLYGRIGVESLAIAPRLSPLLGGQLAGQPAIPDSAFLCSDRGVLFFGPTPQARSIQNHAASPDPEGADGR